MWFSFLLINMLVTNARTGGNGLMCQARQHQLSREKVSSLILPTRENLQQSLCDDGGFALFHHERHELDAGGVGGDLDARLSIVQLLAGLVR